MDTRVDARVSDPGAPQAVKAVLTAAQTHIWLDAVFCTDKPIANTGIVVTLNGALDTELFVQALAQTVAETDTLRIRLAIEREQVRQQVLPLSHISVEQRDFSTFPDAEASARQWIDEQFWTP